MCVCVCVSVCVCMCVLACMRAALSACVCTCSPDLCAEFLCVHGSYSWAYTWLKLRAMLHASAGNRARVTYIVLSHKHRPPSDRPHCVCASAGLPRTWWSELCGRAPCGAWQPRAWQGMPVAAEDRARVELCEFFAPVGPCSPEPGRSCLWLVRIELTTLGLWDLRAANCATATW